VVTYRIATSFILPLAGQSFFEERTMGDKTGGSLSVTVTVKEQRSPFAVVTITLLEPI
jgi:hypothetical protein